MLTSLGLNLYDAAVREIALALLGHIDVAQKYETDTLIGDKTFQFGNIILRFFIIFISIFVILLLLYFLFSLFCFICFISDLFDET